jgi:hypothetical protein
MKILFRISSYAMAFNLGAVVYRLAHGIHVAIWHIVFDVAFLIGLICAAELQNKN